MDQTVTIYFHMQEKYPDSVYLSESTCSHCMEIRSARQPGFELVIVWKIQIDEEGKVFPRLDLLTKVPERALQLDKNKIIETAPLSFRSLLGVLGIEAALDSLIKLLRVEND
ncbi:Centromere protein P [Lemmus lemmus]